ncbi:MAG: tellurite resistance TerB C-terminal domain-containing protein [Janthinobacterium lividum]
MAYYNSYRTRYYSTPLGDLYEGQLQLARKEKTWLNKFTNPANPFLQIVEIREATVRIYLAVMHELEQRSKKAGSTLPKDVRELEEYTRQQEFAGYRHRNYLSYGYVSRTSAGNKEGAPVYLTIFRRCENALRTHYDTKLLDQDIYFTAIAETDRPFGYFFGDAVAALLPPLLATLAPEPDEDLEIAINQQDTARWKPRFEQLRPLLPAQVDQFAVGVYELGRHNERNPLLPTIYLEAARLVGELHREQTIGLYFHYLYYGTRRYPFKPKTFLKRVVKKLFPLPEHLARFEAISQELLRKHDLPSAIDQIPAIYYQERKKIQLDPAAVQAARALHSGTVELLNEYLQDTAEPASAPAKAAAAKPKAAKAAKLAPAKVAAPKAPETAPATSTFAAGLALSAAQQALVQLFAAHRLSLSQTQVEALAQQHGVLRHQLLDSLDNACYELLDDVLVEETTDGYTMYEPYFQKITA